MARVEANSKCDGGIMRILSMFIAATLLVASPGIARASDVTREDVRRAAKVPESKADHASLAKHYDELVAEWKQEAEYHQKMAAAYSGSTLDAKDKEAMEKHCANIAKNALDMAKEAQVMADYHRMRSK